MEDAGCCSVGESSHGWAPADREHQHCALERNPNLSLPVAFSIQLGLCKYLGLGWLNYNFSYFRGTGTRPAHRARTGSSGVFSLGAPHPRCLLCSGFSPLPAVCRELSGDAGRTPLVAQEAGGCSGEAPPALPRRRGLGAQPGRGSLTASPGHPRGGQLAGKCQPERSQPPRVRAPGKHNFTSPSNYSGFYHSQLKTEPINNPDLCLNSCISAYF